MSYATLLIINKKRKIVSVAEYKNAYGGASLIWSYLTKKYLNADSYFRVTENLWKLIDDPRLYIDEKLCLAFTFDYFTASKKHIDLFANALESVGAKTKEEFPSHANHLSAIATDLRKLKTTDFSRICFNCTSVVDLWWEPNVMKKAWWVHKQYPELVENKKALEE